MKKGFRFFSNSQKVTKLLARLFAQELEKEFSKKSFAQNKSALVIALKGDLGAGKTTFVLGFLSHFGIKPQAASPTFVIMKKYAPKLVRTKNKIEFIYHLDAYRLISKKDLIALEFDRILNNPKNIILIEWPEKIKGARFKNKISVNFYLAKNENERIIEFK
jgi:tRNA threonylcarbamoyladenosine biosynthesis protein TsaE